MDFGFSEKQEELRCEVRAFIAEHVTPDVVAEMEGHNEGLLGVTMGTSRGPAVKELFRKIDGRGWLGISYPKEYGGQGGDRITQYIVEEEFARANVNVSTAGSSAPMIMGAGTEEQKRYYIPKLIKGEFSFAQGFTEPRGGADLASLQCRAVKDGDDYVINGQKMYTSGAHYCTHLYLMARTDPTAPKHNGISVFLFPLDTPGLTVRPLWTMQNDPAAPTRTTYGQSRTNEVFFDDVRISKKCLLGNENEGWGIGSKGLNLDRVGAARYLISVMRDEEIINWIKVRKLGQYSPAEDSAMRDRVAELWIEAQVCRLMTLRSMSIVERGGRFTYEGASEKVWAPEHGVRCTEIIGQILGPYAQLLNGSSSAIEKGIFAHNVMGAFQSQINHGSVQVMRDQIARRGWDMPRAKKTGR